MEWSLSQNKLLAFHRLMRTDKPIGALLLLWPTLWALWVASPGVPPLWILAVFVAGVWLMRAAGCVVNDYADRKFDGHVKRTARRPLPSGDVTEKEARTLFGRSAHQPAGRPLVSVAGLSSGELQTWLMNTAPRGCHFTLVNDRLSTTSLSRCAAAR